MKHYRTVGVDIGSENVRVFGDGGQQLLSEPSVIAYNMAENGTRNTRCRGNRAAALLARAPGSATAEYPLRGCDETEQIDGMLTLLGEFSPLIARVGKGCACVICVPDGTGQEDAREICRTASAAGLHRPCVIERSLASAVGEGADIESGLIIVDIGASGTSVAVIADGEVCHRHSTAVGGADFDSAIDRYIKNEYGLIADPSALEGLKLALSGEQTDGAERMEIRGVLSESGLPERVTIRAAELTGIFGRELSALCSGIAVSLAALPPPLAQRAAGGGILLVGGGSLMPGVAANLTAECGINARRAAAAAYIASLGAALAASETLLRRDGSFLRVDRRKRSQN